MFRKRLLHGIFFIVALVAAMALGIYVGPLAMNAYARHFPSPDFVAGNYSGVVEPAGYSVVIFTTSTCPFCRKTRELLDSLHVGYKDYVVDTSDDARQIFSGLNGKSVPMIYTEDRLILGFKESAIRQSVAAIGAGDRNPAALSN